MSSINRQPNGLLGFLGIKNFGRNPTSLGEQLAPTWDISRLYMADAAWWTRVDVAIGAPGYQVFIQVPQEKSITKYSPPRPLIAPPMQVARYL